MCNIRIFQKVKKCHLLIKYNIGCFIEKSYFGVYIIYQKYQFFVFLFSKNATRRKLYDIQKEYLF